MGNRASDIITLVDLTDGVSVVLSSESFAFPGTTTNAIAGSTTTKIQAIQGTQYVAASVNLANVTAPAGVTVTKDTNATAPTLTIAVAGTVTQGGEVIIPVQVAGLTIEKRFSFSIAYKGSQGDPGGQGVAATAVQQGLDAVSIPTNSSGTTAAASTITVPFAGYVGDTRTGAVLTVGTLPSGITVTTNTAATGSADGSLVLSVANASTLGGTDNGEIVLTYVANGKTFVRRLYWVKAKQGTGGATGTSSTSADVRNNAFTVNTDSAGNVAGAQNITIPFGAYVGATRVAATIALTGLPTGMTAGTNTAATASADGNIIVAVANGSNLGGVDSGSFTATVTANSIAFPIIVSWSKAKQGIQGTAGAAALQSGLLNESYTIPANTDGTALAAMTIPVNFYAYLGGNRIAATATVGTLPSGMTVGTNTAGTTAADGVLTLNVASGATLGGTVSGTVPITITANSIARTYNFAWSKAMSGAASITLEVVSASGLIFKNTAVATVLTAKVYVGGTEVTGTARDALGTIKWYKDGTYVTAADGPTLTVAAGDVASSATFEARLEN